MADEKTESELLDEQIAAIEKEEKEAAAAAELEAKRVRVAKHEKKKTLERAGKKEGLDFMLVDGIEPSFFFAVARPEPLVWMAFTKIEKKTQPDWDALYRRVIEPEIWDRASKDIELSPFGVEQRVVAAIMKMLGLAQEERAKK